jgi:hypothetical protein
MGWREQFKAGWTAPAGSWQQRRQAPTPQSQEEPAALPPQDDATLAELSRDLAESKTVVAGLMREIEERDDELGRRRAFAEEQVAARQAAEDAMAQANDRLAKFEAATAALLAENEQLQDRLAAAEAERDCLDADLAAGMTPALCRRFLRAALVVLHPDKFKGVAAITDVPAFVAARYSEIEDAVAKIAPGK